MEVKVTENVAVDVDASKAKSKGTESRRVMELPLDARALEIQYKDPVHGLPCRENIFLDRNDPSTLLARKPRLLVSVESVNMLRQSHKSAENKLQMVRDTLNASRLAFHHELQHLRQLLTTVAAAAAPDVTEKIATAVGDVTSAEQAIEKSPQGGYQVYYFTVEDYLDDRATELIKKANEKVRLELEQEIERLLEQISALGGKGNKQIFVLLLQSGATHSQITEDLCRSMIGDEAERRIMENALTGGLRDKLEFLVQKEESLQAQLEATRQRLLELDEEKGTQHRAIEELRHKVKEARDELTTSKEFNAQVTHEKECLGLEVQKLKKTVEARNAAERHALQKEREEIEEGHRAAYQLALQAEKAANDRHQEVSEVLSAEESIPLPRDDENSEKKEQLALARRRVEEATLMQETWTNRLQTAETSKAACLEKMEDLNQQLAPLKKELTKAPPPDPVREKYEEIQQNLKVLEENKTKMVKDIEKSQKQMTGLKDQMKIAKKVAGVKHESDSENEQNKNSRKDSEDADPAMAGYRERRLLATYGKKKLDIGKFLHDDGESRRRRSAKQIDQFKKAAMTQMLKVLNANAGISVEDEDILAECEKMFGRDSATDGSKEAARQRDGESSSPLKQPADPLRATWPNGFGRPVPKESAEGQQETPPDQQAKILERRLIASERRTAEAQRRLDAAAWTSSRLQDLMNDLGSKLQNALSEERLLREKLPKAVKGFLAKFPAELSGGEIESLLAEYEETMAELTSLEDAVGEAAALIEGRDVKAHEEGSPNGDLAACRVRFEALACNLRESISTAIYAAKDLKLMNELMVFTAEVDHVIMALSKHQDARAELAAQVLKVSEAMQKEQQLEEEMLQVIHSEEARQRLLASELEEVGAAFAGDFSQEMDHCPERAMGLDSQSSSPERALRGESPGSSPERGPDGLPTLQERGSGESTALPADILAPYVSQEGPRRRRRTARNLRRPGAVPGFKPHTMDFGFRQDGGGEESLENWALFKVTKSPDQKDRHGGTVLRRRARAAFPRELRICHSEPKLRQGVSCFSDYISKSQAKPKQILDAHTQSSVWGTNRHRHSLPVIAGVAEPSH